MFPSVNGAGVFLQPRVSATNPGVSFKTNTGIANITAFEVVNNEPYFNKTGSSWTTVNFDVTGSTASAQRVYTFQITPYGNGTFQVRLFGQKPLTVTLNSTATAYYSGLQGGFEAVNYTTAQNSQLIVYYAGVIRFGIVGFSTLFPILVAAVGGVFVFSLIGMAIQIVRPVEEEKQPPSWLPSQTKLMVIAVVAVVGFIVLLVLGASLIQACPAGYTCTG